MHSDITDAYRVDDATLFPSGYRYLRHRLTTMQSLLKGTIHARKEEVTLNGMALQDFRALLKDAIDRLDQHFLVKPPRRPRSKDAPVADENSPRGHNTPLGTILGHAEDL